MRPEACAALMLAPALIGACRSRAEPANNQAAAAPAPVAPSPAEAAQRIVRAHLGGAQDLSFTDAQMFNSAGATVVCGRFAQPGQAAQRYIAVGEQDVFVESRMEPGHMDQAVNEFCRNP